MTFSTDADKNLSFNELKEGFVYEVSLVKKYQTLMNRCLLVKKGNKFSFHKNVHWEDSNFKENNLKSYHEDLNEWKYDPNFKCFKLLFKII